MIFQWMCCVGLLLFLPRLTCLTNCLQTWQNYTKLNFKYDFRIQDSPNISLHNRPTTKWFYCRQNVVIYLGILKLIFMIFKLTLNIFSLISWCLTEIQKLIKTTIDWDQCGETSERMNNCLLYSIQHTPGSTPLSASSCLKFSGGTENTWV